MTKTIDDREIARKLEFFNIGSDDFSRFGGIGRALEKHAPPALDKLYDQIAATPETARFFSSREGMRHARNKQIEHWAGMFNGRADRAYFQSAEVIGNVHARIGLEPGWYIGAYAMVLERVIGGIFSGFTGFFGAKRKARAVGSLLKMALLDMEIAISAYFKAEERARVAVIDEVSATLRAMAEGDFASRVPDLPAAFAELQNHLDGMRKQVSSALSNVADTSMAVGVGAKEIRQASDDLARRTEQQAASLEEASAAMTTLASTVRSSADDAAHMHGSVQEAHGEAMKGGAVVSEAVAAMNDIHGSAQEIGKIISVIDGIAFHRGGAGRRGGARLCRRRHRGPGTGGANRRCGARYQGADQRQFDPGRTRRQPRRPDRQHFCADRRTGRACRGAGEQHRAHGERAGGEHRPGARNRARDGHDDPAERRDGRGSYSGGAQSRQRIAATRDAGREVPARTAGCQWEPAPRRLDIDHDLAEVRAALLMAEGVGQFLEREVTVEHGLDAVLLDARDHAELVRT